MCVLSIKVPLRKKSGNLFNDTRIYIFILSAGQLNCSHPKAFGKWHQLFHRWLRILEDLAVRFFFSPVTALIEIFSLVLHSLFRKGLHGKFLFHVLMDLLMWYISILQIFYHSSASCFFLFLDSSHTFVISISLTCKEFGNMNFYSKSLVRFYGISTSVGY